MRKFMKVFVRRILILVLVATLIAWMSGCSSQSSSSSGGNNPPQGATALRVVSTSPANDATNVSDGASVTATFGEAMDASTINTSTFTVNGVSGTVSYTNRVATLTPSSGLNDETAYTAKITSGAKDLAGNRAVSYSWNFKTEKALDTTAPEVTGTTPSNSAAEVLIDSSIAATFSEAMNNSTVTISYGGKAFLVKAHLEKRR